ncbi:ABC transporter ATP-binding protein [Chitiniphilus shinanonensis]|uniref:ABC transporter ATP-binding protein n=1 Tax=Chitiniphilus shinanonensis TaxID=553088 RepID=UPI00305F5073
MSLLELEQIEVIYENVILAVRGVSLSVDQGRIVALLGANGAGKSTTLKAVSGLVRAERGEVVRGRVRLSGQDITGADPARLAAAGLVQVLEGRHCFGHLTVEDNLKTGAFLRRPSRGELATDLERIYQYFPRLRTRRRSLAGYTSGGEQQMIAIGRALMARPRLVLLDEPSMGLAPQIVEEIFEIVHALNRDEGVSFLLAEQNAAVALRYADYGYVLENGVIAAHDSAQALAGHQDLHAFYLGGAQAA